MIIAVDGPAASGKGTLARKLAAHYGLRYLDTGSLYRAVALSVLSRDASHFDEGAAVSAANALDAALLDDPRLRDPIVGQMASKVAAIADVRQALLDLQRNFANQQRGAVLDGRDIGTVICPDADAKLFVTASLPVRAKRRFAELSQSDAKLTLEEVLADLKARDQRDAARDAAPMRPAGDAHLLETSELDIEAAFQAAIDLIDNELNQQTGCH